MESFSQELEIVVLYEVLSVSVCVVVRLSQLLSE